MPFGLKNGPSKYQEIIQKALGEALYDYAFAYIDDVIIASNTIEEHYDH